MAFVRQKRWLLLIMAAMLLIAPVLACAQAEEEYPARSVEIVIPYSAGGSCDRHARAIVSVAEQYLGHSLVPVIKAGAGATLGVGYAAKQAADGYTWLETAPTPFYRTLVDPLPYTLEDFTALGLISNDPILVVVHGDSPYKTLEDLVEAARAKPGQITAGIVGLYGMQHLVYGFIAAQANIEWNYITQPGGGPAMAAVLGKHNDTTGSLPPVIGAHQEAGTLRALAVAADERLDYDPFKDVPTLKELGYDYTMSLWMPILVRADTPAPIVEKGRILFKQIMDDDSFKKLMKQMGSVPVYMTGPETDAFIRADLAASDKIVKALKK